MYLLVRLHLASHYPEGVVGGVMIDLDSAEGLGSSARRQPLLIAIVIDHHSGPSLANTRLTVRQEVKTERHKSVGSFGSMKATTELLKTKSHSGCSQEIGDLIRHSFKIGNGSQASHLRLQQYGINLIKCIRLWEVHHFLCSTQHTKEVQSLYLRGESSNNCKTAKKTTEVCGSDCTLSR